VFKPRTIFLLIFLVMGLFVAQWQGFSHGISHGLTPTQHQSSGHTLSVEQADHAKHQHAHNDHQSEGKHHCAAYDSQTLSMAMPALPLSLPVIDKTSAAINSYITYQASIEAYRPFDVRGPPNS
jgi:disulfide bond formation protein DsbB